VRRFVGRVQLVERRILVVEVECHRAGVRVETRRRARNGLLLDV